MVGRRLYRLVGGSVKLDHGVAKSRTQLNDFHFHFCCKITIFLTSGNHCAVKKWRSLDLNMVIGIESKYSSSLYHFSSQVASTLYLCSYLLILTLVKNNWTSLVAQTAKHLSTMWKIWVRSLGWEDSLEKEMATHFSTLAQKIPWTEEPGVHGVAKSRTRLSDFTFTF